MSKRMRTPYGLPVRYPLEDGTHIENEFLFGVYEEIFCKAKSKAVTNYYKEARQRGFPNHIHPKVPQKDISHDQLTAYSAYSYMNNLDGYIRIWAFMDGLKYEGRSLHPRDYIYFNLLAGDWRGYVLLPLFYLLCLVSMLQSYRLVKDPVTRPDEVWRWRDWMIRTKLSGELLWVLRYESLKGEWWAKPLKWIIAVGVDSRFGTMYSMVAEYFQNDVNHPILKRWNYGLR